MYKTMIRPALFALTRNNAEKAHRWGVWALQIAGTWPLRCILSWLTKPQGSGMMLWNMHFRSRVGIAGGLDKDGFAALGIQALGAGFTEVGTIVPEPQKGNPHPRVFRLEADEAIINRYGFNSAGKAIVRRHLLRIRPLLCIPLFVNIGKNKDTPNELAHEDYNAGIWTFYEIADVLVFNISSPNTADLRKLQHGEMLEALLKEVSDTMRRAARSRPRKPLVVKIAPDLSAAELGAIIEIANRYADGIIIANTTTKRRGLRSANKVEAGGLSGPMLYARMLAMIRFAVRRTKLPLIAVGGINSPARAQRAIKEGAALVQVYTGLVYEGPGLIKRMNDFIWRHSYC